jgi:threonine/homoserine/homoserine lactone efflux protein
MNEFFACPSYIYGVFVMTIIAYLLTVALGQDLFNESDGASTPAKLFGLAGLAWFLWSMYRFFNRDAKCARVGYPDKRYMNPFSSSSATNSD